LAVTLPKDWADSFNLKEGHYLLVDDSDSGVLKLLTKSQGVETAPRVCVISADSCEAPNMLSRMVIGAYLVGHEIVWIQSRTRFKPEHVRELEELMLSLVGLHISEQTENLIVIESLADPSKPTVDNSIRRLHLISSFMREKVLTALIGGDANDLPNVLSMGKEAQRVYWLAVRQLLSSVNDRKLAQTLGIRSQCWLLGDRAVLTALKAIVNCTETIAREGSKLRDMGFASQSEAFPEISRLDASVTDVSEGAICALMTLDVARANQVIESIKGLDEDARKVMDRLSETIQKSECRNSACSVIYAFGEIIRGYRTIAEIAVNRALEESSDYASVDVGSLTNHQPSR
jgi:phosphate uptake regulator